MIYNVLLAEDEPAAMRHIRTTIEKWCPAFRIIAAAEDGIEAFEEMKKNKVDVLITDIRMPRSDGLELAAKVREEYPGTKTVILSGYQEFEYARKAMKFKVEQYLLKPVNINNFRKMMEELKISLDESSCRKKHEYFESFFSADERSLHKTDRLDKIHLSTIRINGLHPKYHEKMSHNPSSNLKTFLKSILLPEELSNIFLYTGRDSNEFYLICEKDQIHYSRFREIVRDFGDSLDNCHYYTAVISLDITLQGLPEILKSLFTILRNKTVLGSSRIYYDQCNDAVSTPAAVISSVSRSEMEHLFKNGDMANLRIILDEWLEKCKRVKMPLKQIEIEFFQFLGHISANSPDKNCLILKTEIMMDDILQEVKSYPEFLEGLIRILGFLQSSIESTPSCIGSEESFQKIINYIRQHLADDLSVGLICSQFNISHSYLNKLFHKYKEKSVLEFIKEERIKASIDLMKNSPGLPLKDISQIVGYEDSSYFSRVFKSLTGFSPRQYQEQMN